MSKGKYKIIYIYTRIEKSLDISGEAKKAYMQKEALVKHNIQCDFILHNRYRKWNKIFIRLPLYNIYSKKFIDKIIKKTDNSVDAIYIRKYVFDKSFVKLVSRIKKAFPKVKIIVEIPTYPYDAEWKSIIDCPLISKEYRNRNELKKSVDRIVTFSQEEYIFGIKCIRTDNGIDPDLITIKKERFYSGENNEINLIGVALIEEWHGYDRLIEGLRWYYSNNEHPQTVNFHIVGNGPGLEKIKKLTEKYNLSKHVIFYGEKRGEELDDLFNKCDIGVGSLGMYRIDLFNGYTLKLREYMARGIPFIYAYNDPLIEACPVNCSLKFDNDDSLIEINKIIKFWEKIRKKDITNQMREYANKKLTWETLITPIANYIKGEKDD